MLNVRASILATSSPWGKDELTNNKNINEKIEQQDPNIYLVKPGRRLDASIVDAFAICDLRLTRQQVMRGRQKVLYFLIPTPINSPESSARPKVRGR